MQGVRAVSGEEVGPALAEALAGGAPIAPLPSDPRERARTLAMLKTERPVSEPDTAVIVATSGSTGTPKGVVLSRQAISASATATHDRLGGPGSWLVALPSHYVAGLMVLARAVVGGGSARDVGSDLDGLAEATRTCTAPRYLSLVPTQLVRALADPQLRAQLAELDAVLLGGAPAPAELLDRARLAGVPVVTTYGMSETCGGCVYDGLPLPGVQVDLGGADGDRISLTGPMIFSGYRLRPELSATALSERPDGARTFQTQDRGEWRAGRLRVLGRVDDVAITGGLKVDLAQVERIAHEVLGATELAVVGVPNPEWGIRVVAVTDDPGLAEDRLRRLLSARLPAHAVPRELITVPVLPRTSGGKIDRQSLIKLSMTDDDLTKNHGER